MQNASYNSREANLDTQFGLALTYHSSVTFYSTAGLAPVVLDLDQPDPKHNRNEPYLDQLRYFLSFSDEDLPTVLSTSYDENEQNVPESYTTTVCNMFAQLGARGVSAIFSLGDSGLGVSCKTNDEKITTRFLPNFPSSCPFVTSVGATGLVQPEFAAPFSSGGFSERFPRPKWQDTAVEQFLSILGDRWKGLYNPNGCGFPDVSAQRVNFTMFYKGKEISGTGTRYSPSSHPHSPTTLC
jgi:tripeptidyl-peptidase-1